jgi:hypothetical protein
MEHIELRDLQDYEPRQILRWHARFYWLRATGFALGVVLPLIVFIAAIAMGRIKEAVLLCLFVTTPLGFAGFVLSLRSPSFCRQCGGQLDHYWNHEHRPTGRYSGLVAVCQRCRAYETRISRDD